MVPRSHCGGARCFRCTVEEGPGEFNGGLSDTDWAGTLWVVPTKVTAYSTPEHHLIA